MLTASASNPNLKKLKSSKTNLVDHRTRISHFKSSKLKKSKSSKFLIRKKTLKKDLRKNKAFTNLRIRKFKTMPLHKIWEELLIPSSSKFWIKRAPLQRQANLSRNICHLHSYLLSALCSFLILRRTNFPTMRQPLNRQVC